MSEPNDNDRAVVEQLWPSCVGRVGDWPERRIAEYRDRLVKAERERLLVKLGAWMQQNPFEASAWDDMAEMLIKERSEP